MKYLIGKKVGMTQRFLEDGKAVGVTVVQAGPCTVTAVRTKDKEGYDAVQVGFDERKKISKAEKGHLKGLPQYAVLHEFPQKKTVLKRGDALTVQQFVVGDPIEASGVSKGKGFQGVVKRHKFGGSPATHGHKDQLRMPGSIGATDPAHVFRGTRMGGHMGHAKATSTNLEVIEIVPEENLILIKGALPGPNGAIVTLFSVSETEPKQAEAPQAETPKATVLPEAAKDGQKKSEAPKTTQST